MAFIGDWFTFGYDPDFDDGVRAYERGDDLAAATAFRISAHKATTPAQRDRSIERLVASLMRLGRTKASHNDLQSSIDAYAEAAKLRPKYADIRVAAAWAFFAGKNYGMAASEAKAGLDVNPSLLPAQIILALTQALGNDMEEGFARLIELVPAWSIAPASLVNVCRAWSAGDHQAAITMAKGVRPPGPVPSHSLIDDGDKAMKSNQWGVAESFYRLVLAEFPKYADVWVKRGQCLLNLDEFDAANSAFHEALAINPKYARAWSLVGVSCRRMGDEEAALASFRKALEIDPDEPIAIHEVARRR